MPETTDVVEEVEKVEVIDPELEAPADGEKVPVEENQPDGTPKKTDWRAETFKERKTVEDLTEENKTLAETLKQTLENNTQALKERGTKPATEKDDAGDYLTDWDDLFKTDAEEAPKEKADESLTPEAVASLVKSGIEKFQKQHTEDTQKRDAVNAGMKVVDGFLNDAFGQETDKVSARDAIFNKALETDGEPIGVAMALYPNKFAEIIQKDAEVKTRAAVEKEIRAKVATIGGQDLLEGLGYEKPAVNPLLAEDLKEAQELMDDDSELHNKWA